MSDRPNLGDAYPPGTNDADIERAFGDGEPPMIRALSAPTSGPGWAASSAEGYDEGRYTVNAVLGDGVPREVARRPTLHAARVRRWLEARELARCGYRHFAVVVWDEEDPERGDLSTSGEMEGEI